MNDATIAAVAGAVGVILSGVVAGLIAYLNAKSQTRIKEQQEEASLRAKEKDEATKAMDHLINRQREWADGLQKRYDELVVRVSELQRDELECQRSLADARTKIHELTTQVQILASRLESGGKGGGR